ncbi:hypothetical protein [Pseudomonas sp. HY13-MNA-CIBAN-0226]|uniref:hypothetical protein n=1 Tax=Pseudomonas sp. HY13-MNA-CIBAN-0226 TaxID=3140473 RepID=UPI00332690C0
MNIQWKLVPVEPTETMVINGFESEPDECFSDEEVWEQYQEMSGCQQAAFRAKLCWAAMLSAAPAAPEVDAQPVCDHEWTDDGEFLLVCTKCGAQEDHDPKWRDMESAPRDGTLLRLLVSFDEHSTEDADEAPTIGANNFDNDGEDVWRFSGWCWTHDHFTQGVGTPGGWLPMIEASAGTAEFDRVTAERDALQLRLNAADQRIDELVAELAKVRSGPCKMIVGDELP